MGLFDRLFRKTDRADDPPPEVRAVFEKIRRFLNDESAQNQLYGPDIQRLVSSGASIDQNVGAVGEFGRDPRNAIPVNGPLGELLYISQLVTATRSHLMGHRLGAIAHADVTGHVDVYEVASFDGSCWDILFFDMYHPRKSCRLPAGFQLEVDGFILATNVKLADFPRDIRESISRCTKNFLGVPLVSPKFRDENLIGRLSRPQKQASTINSLRLANQD